MTASLPRLLQAKGIGVKEAMDRVRHTYRSQCRPGAEAGPRVGQGYRSQSGTEVPGTRGPGRRPYQWRAGPQVPGEERRGCQGRPKADDWEALTTLARIQSTICKEAGDAGLLRAGVGVRVGGGRSRNPTGGYSLGPSADRDCRGAFLLDSVGIASEDRIDQSRRT
jgi:hypothetical protein